MDIKDWCKTCHWNYNKNKYFNCDRACQNLQMESIAKDARVIKAVLDPLSSIELLAKDIRIIFYPHKY